VDTFVDIKQRVAGVELGQLEPLTTLLVFTWNSMYRVIVAGGSDVLVQGGSYFPDPTPAQIDGASAGGGPLLTGWIGVGLVVEFRMNGKRIVTSPVVAIATRRPGFQLHMSG
jgi:hypothetical protein